MGGRSTADVVPYPEEHRRRSRPSRVCSAYSTSAASAGSTQVTSEARTRGMRGVCSSGLVGRCVARAPRAAGRRRRPRSPSQRCPPSGARRARDARGRAHPASRDGPCRVYPTIGRSSRERSFTFCHSGVRRPGGTGRPRAWRRRPPGAAPRRPRAAPVVEGRRERTASTEGSRSPSRSRLRSSRGRSRIGSSSSSSRSKAIRTRRPEPDWSASKRAAPPRRGRRPRRREQRTVTAPRGRPPVRRRESAR